MKRARQVRLLLSALCELARYEVTIWSRGSGRILSQLKLQCVTTKPTNYESQQAISDAVLLATCLYWKPVLCLQRAVCTVRLLRRHGIVARLVIGYRPSPFFSHAWVEVGGRVVYGSPAYQKRLRPLHVV
jgi:hypothetical protein